MKKNVAITALSAAFVLTGCAHFSNNDANNNGKPLNMANPAAVYCVEQDGKLETVTENNQRVTYCVFSDNSRTEQWEYFRQNHQQNKETSTQ